MQISRYHHTVDTHGFNDCHDVTQPLRDAIEESGVTEGLATVFVPGSTAGVTTIEYESGAVQDLQRAITSLAPEGQPYAHDERWGDMNGFSHVRAALLGPAVTIPVAEGEPMLGTWQQVILVDCDNRSRERQVLIQVLGQ